MINVLIFVWPTVSNINVSVPKFQELLATIEKILQIIESVGSGFPRRGYCSVIEGPN